MEPDYIQLKDIKPVLMGYIRKSRTLLMKDAVPDEDAVHDIRVLMKKARAILRLAGQQLVTDSPDRDIRDFRRVGQIMCEWRDTSVHRKTLKELRKEYPEIFSKLEDNEKINSLIRKQEKVSEPDAEMKKGIDEIDELLNKAACRIRFHQMKNIDPVILLRDLELSYASVMNIYLECRNRTRPRKLHEFRKRSKDFLYQLSIFRPLNPPVIRALEKKLEITAMYLGMYNDLYQLITTLGYEYPGEPNIPVMDELVIKIREKQDACLARVWSSVKKVFCPGTRMVNLLGFKLLVI